MKLNIEIDSIEELELLSKFLNHEKTEEKSEAKKKRKKRKTETEVVETPEPETETEVEPEPETEVEVEPETEVEVEPEALTPEAETENPEAETENPEAEAETPDISDDQMRKAVIDCGHEFGRAVLAEILASVGCKTAAEVPQSKRAAVLKKLKAGDVDA